MSELLTLEEAADLLRIGKRTVERFVALGDIGSVKIGRRRLIPASELERYVRLAQRRGRVA